MERIVSTPRIKKFKRRLEKALSIKIHFLEDTAEIESIGESGIEEYTALSVIEAMNFGFDLNIALQLKNEDYMMEKLNLRKHVRSSRISTIRGRIIGLGGKTKRIIADLSDCGIALKDNIIAIIGKTDDVKVASRAVTLLMQGSPHSSVYAFLEKNRKIRKEDDMGFRNEDF